MNASRLSLDLNGLEMDDKQLAEFRNLFRFVLHKAMIEKTRGNLVIPLDGRGHLGQVKVESWHDVGANGTGGKPELLVEKHG